MTIKQPTDKSHFLLPDLGEGVHEAELIKWKVEPGETVEEHQTLAEMETDKAMVEVPSPWAGTIDELNADEGEIVNVGNILVTYTGSAKDAGESANGEVAASSQISASEEDAGTVVGSVDTTLSVPGRFTRQMSTSSTTTTKSSKSLATPAVRKIAKDLGVPINSVAGTGRGGRVTASDVHEHASGTTKTPHAASIAPPTNVPAPSRTNVAQRIPFRGVRRKIAEALSTSINTAVHFTVSDEADVTELDRKRKEYSRVVGQKLGYLPFIMVATIRALQDHPSLNANVDDQASEILLKDAVHLGCAVDTDHGLMVPVIEDAQVLSVVELARRVAELAAGCRDRSISRDHLIGGTFTISNVGSYGGMYATPIINYPEVGILATGRVTERVMTRDSMFYAGKVLPMSLSCDHRVVDGAEGARFLHTIVKLLESPEHLFGA